MNYTLNIDTNKNKHRKRALKALFLLEKNKLVLVFKRENYKELIMKNLAI